ncbi:hypothetical protein VCHC62B1_3353B, partial [Vibrio cholerae HC-62B1]
PHRYMFTQSMLMN